VLTSLWSWYLRRMEQLEPVTHTALRDDLVGSIDWASADLSSSATVSDSTEAAVASLPDGGAIVDGAYRAAEDADEPGKPFAAGLLTLLALAAAANDETPGFAELRDEGGPGRWSLEHLRRWLALRSADSLERTAHALFDEIHYQHVRVALPKLSPTDHRDPF